MSEDNKKSTPTGRTGRFLKLAGMTASVATRYATHRIKQAFEEEDQRDASRSEVGGDGSVLTSLRSLAFCKGSPDEACPGDRPPETEAIASCHARDSCLV